MPKLLDPDEMPEWLASLWPAIGRNPSIIAGVNDDDCAVLQWSDELLVVTTDYLNAHPIATELGIGTVADLGRLVVAANLSDLCGSGAEPRALLIGVTMEFGATETEFQCLMRGVREEAERWAVPVVGGDTKLGKSRAVLGVGIGSAPSTDNLFLKSRAGAGDLVWCSGPIGSCNAAAVGLRRSDMTIEWKQWAKAAILTPSLPLRKSRLLSSECLGAAGVDISDGLGADLEKMCRSSGVGAIVDAQSIPLDPHVCELARRVGVEPWAFAFGAGGDFQFIVSTARAHTDKMEGLGFHNMGQLTPGPGLLLRVGNTVVDLPVRGHRDARGLSFADEILSSIDDISGLTKGK
jgi:thiamine-monophosphate kinase